MNGCLSACRSCLPWRSPSASLCSRFRPHAELLLISTAAAAAAADAVAFVGDAGAGGNLGVGGLSIPIFQDSPHLVCDTFIVNLVSELQSVPHPFFEPRVVERARGQVVDCLTYDVIISKLHTSAQRGGLPLPSNRRY